MKQQEKNKISTERIINAAVKEITLCNSRDFSVNELCRKNGISKGMFYHYFSSKEELFYSAVSLSVNKLADDIERFSVNPDLTTAENLLRYYKLRIDFWDDNPYDFLLIRFAIKDFTPQDWNRVSFAKNRYYSTFYRKIYAVINAENRKLIVDSNNIIEIMRLVYEKVFWDRMEKIVRFILADDIDNAEKSRAELLNLYGNLINLLLHGMFAKE